MARADAWRAEEWARTDALHLHVAMCLLAGEWRDCAHCRPLVASLMPAVSDTSTTANGAGGGSAPMADVCGDCGRERRPNGGGPHIGCHGGEECLALAVSRLRAELAELEQESDERGQKLNQQSEELAEKDKRISACANCLKEIIGYAAMRADELSRYTAITGREATAACERARELLNSVGILSPGDRGASLGIRPPKPSGSAEVSAHGAEAKQIKYMVNRFLSWRLPDNFCPDAGISFKATFNEHTAYPGRHEPTGTNLFDATQAEAMVRHMIEGLPSGEPVPCSGCAEKDKALAEMKEQLRPGIPQSPPPLASCAGLDWHFKTRDALTAERAKTALLEKQLSEKDKALREAREHLESAAIGGFYPEPEDRSDIEALLARIDRALSGEPSEGEIK